MSTSKNCPTAGAPVRAPRSHGPIGQPGPAAAGRVLPLHTPSTPLYDESPKGTGTGNFGWKGHHVPETGSKWGQTEPRSRIRPRRGLPAPQGEHGSHPVSATLGFPEPLLFPRWGLHGRWPPTPGRARPLPSEALPRGQSTVTNKLPRAFSVVGEEKSWRATREVPPSGVTHCV